MKFWDTSAIVPLLIEEENSEVVAPIFLEDTSMVVWWGTSIECISAISRLEREAKITAKQANQIITQFNEIRVSWREIQAINLVKQHAERILKVHPLRAQDAQQLAACIVASSNHMMEFVTLDKRLDIAARKEGLKLTMDL
jgi:uncharacterized protein